MPPDQTKHQGYSQRIDTPWKTVAPRIFTKTPSPNYKDMKMLDSKPALAIFGSYNGGSIGDTLILIGLIDSLSRVLPKGSTINIYHLSNEDLLRNSDLQILAEDSGLIVRLASIKSAKYKRAIGRVLYNLLPVKKETKLKILARFTLDPKRIEGNRLVIGGGNLIMDLFELWPFILKEVTLASINRKISYSFLGIGAGPLLTDAGRSLLKETLDGSRCAIFRDRESLELCKSELNFKNSMDYPDIALGLKADKYVFKGNTDSTLGINISGAWGSIWPYTDIHRYDKMIKSYALLANKLIKTFGFKRIILIISNIADLKAANDLEYAAKSMLPGLEMSYSDYSSLSPVGLISAVSRCSFVVATRLHACLASALAMRRVIAISYQPKVKDVISSCLPGARIFQLQELIDNPDEVAAAVASEILTRNNPEYFLGLPRQRMLVDKAVKISIEGTCGHQQV